MAIVDTADEAAAPGASATPATGTRDPWYRAAAGYLVLALVAFVPPLLTAPGKVAADTKQYLYLDPNRLLARAVSMWDSHIGMGTVTHQNIGYTFPMGPYYWAMDHLGVPDWVAQRLWLGSLLFFAAVGMLYLLRSFGMRGPGVVVAAFAYMCTPYVLDYAARISVLLMPWAALPWMIALTRKALRDDRKGWRSGWRYPAIFALVVQIVGGVNATALIFAGVAPVLWIVYAWLVAHDVTFRRALVVTARIGVLTLFSSLWWISGLRMQGTYGLNILKYTETVEAVARTSTPNEVLRGLGYWFFYGQDRLGSWIEAARDYTQHDYVILAGYGLVVLSLLAIAYARWRHRIYFVALLLIGVVISVGAHPYESPTPLGGLFKAFATGSTAGLALRSTARAVPLVVLSLAVFLGLGANALFRRFSARHQRVLAWSMPVLAAVLVFVNFPALVNGTYYGKNLQRDETIPAYWRQAIAALDRQSHQTRILEEPGADFASYTWGNTVDPITPGLTDRPYVARELIPYGTAGTADLLNAMDRRIQENVADPHGLTAIWRLMGVGDVVARNDIQYERYDLVRPHDLAAVLAAAPGLGRPKGYGEPSPFAPASGHEDELTLQGPVALSPLAPVVDYPVNNPLPIVRGESATHGVMLSGDGEGLVDTADVGVLDGAGVVRYAASYTTPAALRAATAAGDVLVVSDSNRLRARRWTSVKDNLGYTEQAGERDAPLSTDLGDARLDVFPGQQAGAQTTTVDVGVSRVQTDNYGNTITYTPEDRGARAFDGDPYTAWRTQAFGDARGQRIRAELDGTITTDHVNLVQPLNGGRNRWITEVELRFDGGHPVRVALNDASRGAEGQTISFPTRTFHTFQITITKVSDPRVNLFGQADAVGFAEIRLRDAHAAHDVQLHEIEQMPSDLLDALGPASADHPLVLVLRRESTQPVPPRTQPELALDREFTLPTARTFAVTGNATISLEAPDPQIEQSLGIPDAAHGGVTVASKEFLQGCIACRADAAIDGDPATAWQTPFVGVVGQWADFTSPKLLSFDHLDLQLVADGRHSVPTRLQITVDGKVQHVDIPLIADNPNRPVTPVRVSFPRLTGHKVSVDIESVREERALSYGTAATRVEPAAIAELGVPGLQLPAPRPRIDSGCRSDLVAVDGKPFPVRVTGATAKADAVVGLTVTPCGAPLTLAAGRHVLTTARGKDVGFSIDRLVLASGDAATTTSVADGRVTALGAPAATPAKVTVTRDGDTKVRVHVSDASQPFWLVLGESQSPGWNARVVHGADLGASQLVDGYANGWKAPAASATGYDVVLEWKPQQQVWASLWISLFTALLCLGIVLVGGWRRRGRLAAAVAPLAGDADFDVDWSPAHEPAPLPRRVRWIAPVAAGLLAALVVAPWVGLLVGALAAVIAWRPRTRDAIVALPAVLLGMCGVYIALEQYRYKYPSVFEWPTVFPRARTLAWVAVMVLVADVIVELVRRRMQNESEGST